MREQIAFLPGFLNKKSDHYCWLDKNDHFLHLSAIRSTAMHKNMITSHIESISAIFNRKNPADCPIAALFDDLKL